MGEGIIYSRALVSQGPDFSNKWENIFKKKAVTLQKWNVLHGHLFQIVQCSFLTFSNPLCDAFTFQSSGDICRHYLRVGQLQENQIRSRSGVDLHMRSSCDPVPTGKLFFHLALLSTKIQINFFLCTLVSLCHLLVVFSNIFQIDCEKRFLHCVATVILHFMTTVLLFHNDYIYYFKAPPTSQPPSGTCIKLSYQTLVGFALFQVPGTPAAVTAPSSK